MTQAILEAIQDVIQSVDDFDDTAVVINDWSFFDETRSVEQWCLIESGGLIGATFEMNGDKRTWLIPVKIVMVFNGDWNATRAALCALRVEILDAVTGNNAALPSVGDGVYRSVENIVDVNSNEPVQPELTAAFLEALQSGDAIPDYLQLQMLWTVYEEIC